MYNFKKYLWVLVACCSISLGQAQIMMVTENDRGRMRPVQVDDAQIIDINATLEVSISKSALKEAIKTQFPEYSESITLDENIALLDQALKNQEAILNILEEKIASNEAQTEFFSLMIEFLELVEAHPVLSMRYEALSEEYFSPKGELSGLEMEAYIFANLNSDLVASREALKNMGAAKYAISVMAFKKDKQGGDRVHVKNYDNYTERDYFTVERWVTTLTESQKLQLEALAEKAKENNKKAISIFKELKALFKANFPSAECVKEQKDLFLTFINNPRVANQLTDAVEAKIQDIKLELNKIISLINIFKEGIDSWDIASPFQLGAEFKGIFKSAEAIHFDFGSFEELLGAISTLKAEVAQLASGFKDCITHIQTDFEKLQQTLDFLLNQQSNYLLNKNIGDEVLAFGIDNLPESGYINLKGTGQRSNGDELLLEIVLRVPSSKPGLPEQVLTLEQRHFVMQLIGARSEVAVGLIMANPYNETALGFTPERKFYFSPSASLLLKFGSKKSYFYNEFIDLGVGINFASPDFDTNGTPEFGTGIIVTAFKDIISVGLNYNVTLDAPYWFFGINLPFNLPGLPVNNIK